jgi:hypothetical protein
LELLYLQVDKVVMCMNIISTFHIMVIIYQSIDVKVCWKILTTNQFQTYFSSTFLYRIFFELYVQLTINSIKSSMISHGWKHMKPPKNSLELESTCKSLIPKKNAFCTLKGSWACWWEWCKWWIFCKSINSQVCS